MPPTVPYVFPAGRQEEQSNNHDDLLALPAERCWCRGMHRQLGSLWDPTETGRAIHRRVCLRKQVHCVLGSLFRTPQHPYSPSAMARPREMEA